MSATCDAIGPELVAYLDGALADDERRPIASHVSTCLVCRREIERLTTVQRWVSDLPPIEPSRDFAATFWERMESEPIATDRGSRLSRPLRPLRWIVPVLAAAAVLALTVRSLLPGPSTPGGHVAPAPRAPEVAAMKAERPKIATAPAAAKPAPAQLANVEDLKPEDLPPELLEHPELFLRLPVVRRLETLEHIDAVKREQQTEDSAG